jgi:Asp-tRNA(Asn)/Glu-tRNA(Gln) amidotransferase A subunit family amidase
MAAERAVPLGDPVALREALLRGSLRAVEVTEVALARIREREPGVQAWAWHDPDFARHQAKALDDYRASGGPVGPLHGLPVGIKDIVDTARIPTENGTVIDRGRVPLADATVVEKLKAAGAVIMGKTVTTELALFTPSKTRNPVDPERSPGGSSAGSAAAVAAGMVPFAIGSQTAGSIIRPASFCGTVGFKPTFGRISRRGVLAQAPSLDTLGVLATDVAGAAMLAEVLFGHDSGDPSTAPAPPPRLLETALAEPPLPPIFAFVRTPYWERASDVVRTAFEELMAVLGDQCFAVELPPAFAEADAVRQRIQFAELAKCYYGYARRGFDQLSPAMQGVIERGNATPARDYIAALDWADILNAGLDEIFQRCDAILTPAAPGPAPVFADGTGDPVFNALWTLCRAPTVTVPVFETETGLPMGAQLVGRRGDDGRLLRTARWLATFVAAANHEE